MTKFCKKCAVDTKRYATGKCKPCIARRRIAWRTVNPERDAASLKKWRAKNRERVNAAGKKWRAANPGRWRIAAGLPEATRPCPDFCECCGRLPTTGMCLDHCHVTGTFRGWLCRSCNRAAGFLGDTVEDVRKLVQYLERAAR